ncbi:MAG: sulfite exporter TauE/SafE family protein [Spirochaetota bacterium]|nr:sulfite exporter TauE/SafE family protein [Spirochaetota bacterium]
MAGFFHSLFALTPSMGIALIGIAFLAEYTDSTLGMGYGTSLTPILLLMGFDPMQIVPAILLSELVTGLLAGFTHHSMGNVDLLPRTLNVVRITRAIRSLGLAESYRRGIPTHLKIVLLISACSIAGTVAAVLLAVSLPAFYLKLYIGLLILIIGIVILIRRAASPRFSWKKITLLGLIASFNKGMSGGGYGPVVTGGQILSGIEGKNAVAITSMAEGLTCLIGVMTYLGTGARIDWQLAPYLLAGAVVSVPLSAFTVKLIKTSTLRTVIGSLTVLLGCLTLYKVVLM